MKPVFPDIRELADAEAARAQLTFLAVNLLQLMSMIIAATLGGVTARSEGCQRALAWGVCCLMTISLLSATALRIGKFDVRWFRCRAFAENAKSLAWRYVMGTDGACMADKDAYLLEWGLLKDRLPEIQKEFAITSNSGKLITDWMIQASQLSIAEKLSVFRKYRVTDQIEWYATNSKINADRRSQWFWVLFSVEAMAVIYSAVQALSLGQMNFVGLFVAVCSGIVAWSQIKRHSDLCTSYAIASEDLTLISERFAATTIVDQSTLSAFVNDVEEAVSREHSLWLARRSC